MSLQELSGPDHFGLLPLLEFVFAPRWFTQRNAAKFGRVYRVRWPGGHVLFTADPEHIKRVFAADSDAFETLTKYSLGPVLGAHSVLVTAGPTHKRQRKLLAPPLTGARLRAFGETMQRIADRHVAALDPGSKFRVLDFSTAFTLDVIVQTVFGAAEAEAGELRQLLTALVDSVPPIALFLPVLQQPWFPPWSRYLRARERFDTWLARKLAERREGGVPGEDVLSLLLDVRYDDGSSMEDEEIRHQLVTLLLAGHETTSIAVARCVYRIHHHPEVLERLLAELDAHADAGTEAVQRLPYLSAVIDETLRIDPVVTDTSRVCRTDFALDSELMLKAQEPFLVVIEALHHDPSLYPQPATFRPERFIERKYAPYEFLPFGGGVRRCLGAAFSDYETKIVIASLLRQRSLALVDRRPEPRVRRNITMGPKRGVPMRVLARR